MMVAEIFQVKVALQSTPICEKITVHALNNTAESNLMTLAETALYGPRKPALVDVRN